MATDTVTQIAELLEDRDTGIWFALLAESGAIEAQAWQLRDVLKDRGVKIRLRDVQDAMLQLAHELLGADDPRDELGRELGRWASMQPQEVQERLAGVLEGSCQEAFDGGVASFRAYLRGCCERALERSAA